MSKLLLGTIFTVFSFIQAPLIDKDLCECQNVLSFCVFHSETSLLFFFCVICSSVFSISLRGIFTKNNVL